MKKMKLFCIYLMVYLQCCTLTAFSQNRSVNFEKGSWEEVKQKAKTESKLIFLDAYTSWCGPCKLMAKNVFTNDSVADFYNAHFISISMDMEKGEGRLLASKYHVNAYPTLMFLNDSGQVVHQELGSMEPAAFISLGNTALNPEKQNEALKKKYTAGNRDPAFIREYLKMLFNAGQKTKEIADWYFAMQNNQDLLTLENFEMIDMLLDDIDSPLFQYFFINRAKFSAIAGRDRVETKITALYNSLFDKCHKKETQPDSTYTLTFDAHELDRAKEIIMKSGYEKSDELLAFADVLYYGDKGDYKKYTATIDGYLKFKKNDWMYLNIYAWMIYMNENIKDDSLLALALGWSKQSLAINSNYQNNDTYAGLLYKLKKKKEAIKAAEIAIAKGKEENLDYSATEELLIKIKELR
jgi:thioredoxin-related protein